jgi:aminopeptidase N
VGLRDLSGVVVGGDLQSGEVDVDGLIVRATAPVGRSPEAVAGEAAASAEVLAEAFGPLPWRQIDVVGVPLGHAGMEFPGMAWLDSTRWTSDGGFASYVNAHEIGHQWFHALVGNGSLSAPFLDESLAQYAAYLVFAATYGEERAASLADDQFGGRYNRAGQPGDPVCLALGEFSSASAYGAVVYGRGGQVWVDLEREYGRERVIAVLATWIDQVGLGSGVMPADLVAAAAAAGDVDVEPELAALLLDERC